MLSPFRMGSTLKYFLNSKHVISFSRCNHFTSLYSKNSSLFSLKGVQFSRGVVVAPKRAEISPFEDISAPFVSFKYLRLIKKSIREGGPIIEENEKLKVLLSKAREHKMSEDYISFLQRISMDMRTTLGLVEILLDNQCHLIIQYEDIDLSVTKPHLLKLCEMYDGYLLRKDVKWPLRFQQVGMLFIPNDEKVSLLKDLKQDSSVASKCGALSVQSIVDAEKIPYWRFYCEPSKLHEVKLQLEKENCEVEEAYVGYIPRHKVSLSNLAKKTLYSVITDMSKIPTIDNVFINI